jgi:polysaccharide pyruvyl transferase WcaK-like protein
VIVRRLDLAEPQRALVERAARVDPPPRAPDEDATEASRSDRGGGPRVTFWGNFGAGNLGNECTLAAVLSRARVLVPAAQLLVACTGAEAAAREHGVETVGLRPASSADEDDSRRSRILRRVVGELETVRTALRVMRHADTLIMSGTGMLSDYGEGQFGFVYEMCKWALAARLCGRRVCFASVGTEHLDHWLSRFFVRTTLRLASFRAFRDEQSREHIRRIGFASDRDRIFPDLAFSLPESLLRPAEAAARADADAGPTVAVGAYDLRMRPSGPSRLTYEEYVVELTSFVQWLIAGGRRVRLIVGDTRYDIQVLRDTLASLAARGLRPGEGRLVCEPVSTFGELIAQLAGTSAVVATRFHNVILALLLGKPVLAISYNPKVATLMESAGLGRYVQTIGELDAERLAAQFRELEGNAGLISQGIRAKTRQYRDELEEEYRILFGGGVSPA